MTSLNHFFLTVLHDSYHYSLYHQKEEVLAAGQLHEKGENQELKNKLLDLQEEV